jgi:hypothetical protein
MRRAWNSFTKQGKKPCRDVLYREFQWLRLTPKSAP